MNFDSKIHHRQSIRLKNYDYSQNGMYFVTICTQDWKYLFGKVVDGNMNLNRYGKIAKKYWQEIPKHYPDVTLDVFIVMPNHVHGILTIQNDNHVGAQNLAPLQKNKTTRNLALSQEKKHQFQKIIPRSLGSIIRGYKIGVTKWFRANTNIHIVWQRNYHEHIIRNEKSLKKIRNYIFHNATKWKKDKFYKN
jgi:REP element-mobilizing transposase RayT